MKDKETIIEVRNLTKKYGRNFAVNDVSFNVYKNEIFGILGPNGAGKTTSLEIIETLRKKTSGSVIVGGYNIDRDQAKIKSIIGVQLQSSGFFQELKLKEIIALFAALYDIKVKPLEVLKKVDLVEKANSFVKDLSGGQRQRFSIATTIINEPKIIFLDEPSTGLDPQARRNLWELIKKIRTHGTTVVLTTHFMDEAEYLSDRVAIIDEGKILKIEKPETLVDELIKKGFKRHKKQKLANLEDVFLDFTGKHLRDTI